MLIRPRRKQAYQLELSLNNSLIEQVNKFKYLGVWFNDTLSWDDHIHYVHTRVSAKIHLLRHLSWFLPKPALSTFYQAYILAILDYCDVVWSGITSTNAIKLESLQNYCARIILRRSKLSSATNNRLSL